MGATDAETAARIGCHADSIAALFTDADPALLLAGVGLLPEGGGSLN
jgi:hypothetical protein